MEIYFFYRIIYIIFSFSPEVPTKKRVERWAISLEDTVTDPLGAQVRQCFIYT